MGFTDMDKECWAIDNFDARQNLSTLYNPKYYIDFIERAGFDIVCRWQQNIVMSDKPVPDKVARINALIQEKYDVHLLQVKRRKDIYPYARKFFLTLNEAFKDLFDFVPLTDKEIDVYIIRFVAVAFYDPGKDRSVVVFHELPRSPCFFDLPTVPDYSTTGGLQKDLKKMMMCGNLSTYLSLMPYFPSCKRTGPVLSSF